MTGEENRQRRINMPTVKELKEHLEIYDDADVIAWDIWCVEDVEHRECDLEIELTDTEREAAINLMDRRSDSNIGFNWDVLDACMDEVVSRREKAANGKYHVHLYPVVKVVVDVEADSPIEAIEKAEEQVDLCNLFKLTDIPKGVIETEYADELNEAFADLVGDDPENSMWYERRAGNWEEE
jgi:hypothetical protein